MSTAESSPSYGKMESHESLNDFVEKIINKIKGLRSKIEKRFGLSNSAEITKMTDEALVYNAKETISAADEDGVRTDEELADIEDAMSSVVIEGAMEQSGIIEAQVGENPIKELDEDPDTASDLLNSIRKFNEGDIKLPNGESVAGLAVDAIENGKAENAESDRKHVSLSEAIRSIRKGEYIRSGETLYFPRAEIICDRNHVEDQRIDVMNNLDKKKVEMSLKLRFSQTFEDGEVTDSGAKVSLGDFKYEDGKSGKAFKLCDAYILEKDKLKFYVAKDEKVRAAIGLIRVEAPNNMRPEKIERIMSDVLAKDFNVPDALEEPTDRSEQEYKQARYAWEHCIQNDLDNEQKQAAERLSYKEVFPGYTTLVEEGKHKEYLERFGDDIRAMHQLGTGNAESIYRMLTMGGMCSSERFKRGVIRNGMSTREDFHTGGADSFFTRMHHKEHVNLMTQAGAVVVFKPELFDRTDWYIYRTDTFGSTEESKFSRRIAPDKMMNSIKNKREDDFNEQMFRTGIGPDYIENIVVPDYKRSEIIKVLKEKQMDTFDGRPIEEAIVSHVEASNSEKES